MIRLAKGKDVDNKYKIIIKNFRSCQDLLIYVNSTDPPFSGSSDTSGSRFFDDDEPSSEDGSVDYGPIGMPEDVDRADEDDYVVGHSIPNTEERSAYSKRKNYFTVMLSVSNTHSLNIKQ